ncbi:sensor histidine kinase KdpD [Microvirgula aerodenitrificans]|uniref:sensor histidine kinase KdpD n=1 Tax=Microvirgula aerodenitrificans TaxID=57480 RepID=UPI0028EF21BE|nr:sensor histidine kinase KdpD [Microvirgula aerodenitrificans]
MNDTRPDPDRLLESLSRDSERAARGKLKIFFGACAGVGKTYAMLSAAREQLQAGANVLIGVAETHGRVETAALLDGLPILPPRAVEYRGRTLAEFDLDAALAAKPALIIVDELAHSNVAGSRHPKRWQDIEALLAAGIDVYTALNVQHLESLNDVVGRITGIRVAETVPDRVFDAAEDVILCDLPPDELLNRLKAGKVYLAGQAERAAGHFFRKGNLLALRELALRRTAARVDAEMRAWRADRDIRPVWPAVPRLLACVGPDGGEQVVRATARLAESLRADWLAVYVETPQLARASAEVRGRALSALQLAAELGAETVSLAGDDIAAALQECASRHNAGTVVLGAGSRRRGWAGLRPRLAESLARLAPGLELHQIALDVPRAPIRSRQPRRTDWRGYAWTVAIGVLTTALTALLLTVFDLANVVMVYLVAVVGIAYRWGRGPGALAALLAVGGLDFFFVPPRFSFTVADGQYLFTFVLMLAVALGIGQLAARLRFAADVARARERRAYALAALARELSAALTLDQVVECLPRHLDGALGAVSVLLLPDSHERVRAATSDGQGGDWVPDSAVAQWVYDSGQAAGAGTRTLSAATARYLPLKAPMRIRGVLGLRPADLARLDEPETVQWLEASAAQIALAIERIHYVEVAQDVLVKMESERLRHALLASVSHDLRTPLTALVGLAETAANPAQPAATRDGLASAVHHEAKRLAALVDNLLALARLQAGGVRLNREWQAVEEVVGSALRASAASLGGHRVETRLPAELPLVQFDAVMIERVLCNLLDNAAKYTPAGSRVRLFARVDGHHLVVGVEDDGPGLPDGDPERLFDTFARGERESATPGAGLGLALARSIIDAHGGKMQAESLTGGGARLSFTLPLTTPPDIDAAESDA